MADITKGRFTDLFLVSATHGRKETNFVQSLEITPNGSAESYGEFGTKDSVITLKDFPDVDASFDVLISDQKSVLSMLMDVDPASTTLVYDNQTTAPVTLYGEYKSASNEANVFGSFLVANLSLSGSPITQDLGTASTQSFSLKGTFMRQAIGAKMLYSRCVPVGFTGFVTADDQTFSGTNDVTLAETPVVFDNGGGLTTSNYVLVLKNGTKVDTGFTLVGSLFDLTSAPAVTDVWEVFTLYV